MAEIKSSLEIALARAAALGGGGSEEIAREEGAKRGQVAARKLLIGQLEPTAMAAEMGSLSGEGKAAARRAAGRVLLEGLSQTPSRALAGLAALTERDSGAPQAIKRLSKALEAMAEAENQLADNLAAEMKDDLARAGISGSAVRPNPLAHPGFAQRREAALADGEKLYQAALRETAEVLDLA